MAWIHEAVCSRGGKRVAPAETNKAPDSEPKRVASGGKKPLIIIAVILGIIAAGYLGLSAYANSLDIFLPRTSINGVDVSSLTLAQAQTRVQAEFPERIITLESAGETLGSASVKEMGYSGTDIPQQVQQCWSAEQKQGLLRRGWQYLRSLLGFETSYTFLAQRDDAAFSAYVHQLSQALQQPAQDTSYQISDGKLTVTRGRDGRAVDEQKLRSILEKAVQQSVDPRTAEITFSTLPAVGLTAQELHDKVHGEMKNAGYDSATDSITPEQVGADFDVKAAQSLMDAAEPGSTVTLDATIEYPHVTAEQLEAVLFRDVLGQATTKVSGTAARISNVKLASAAFNGYVLNSGDVFSYNGVVGQRTTARGYLPAPAYVRGETVDEVGGGVCQPSSTLYLACLLADLQIVDRINHRYIPSYIAWGSDATVSWGGPDYQFSNNTDYPVKIVTSYANGYLTVKLLGTNVTGQYAKVTNKVISTTNWETIYEEDPTMAPGSPEVVKVTPYTGHKVETYHTIYDASGKVIDSHLESRDTYAVRNKVILRAPGGTPAVNPQPLPETPETPTTPVTPPETPEIPEAPLTPETPQEPSVPETPIIVPDEMGALPPDA